MILDRWDPDRGGAEAAAAAFVSHAILRGHEVHVFGVEASPGAPGVFHAVHAGGPGQWEIRVLDWNTPALRFWSAAATDQCKKAVTPSKAIVNGKQWHVLSFDVQKHA